MFPILTETHVQPLQALASQGGVVALGYALVSTQPADLTLRVSSPKSVATHIPVVASPTGLFVINSILVFIRRNVNTLSVIFCKTFYLALLCILCKV